MLRDGLDAAHASSASPSDIGMTSGAWSAASCSPPLVAVPLGIAMGAYKPVEAFFEPFVSFARYLPASAFIPLLILWAGIGETQKLLVIFIGSFFQIVLMVAVTVGNDAARPGRGRLHARRRRRGRRAPRAAARRRAARSPRSCAWCSAGPGPT